MEISKSAYATLPLIRGAGRVKIVGGQLLWGDSYCGRGQVVTSWPFGFKIIVAKFVSQHLVGDEFISRALNMLLDK